MLLCYPLLLYKCVAFENLNLNRKVRVIQAALVIRGFNYSRTRKQEKTTNNKRKILCLANFSLKSGIWYLRIAISQVNCLNVRIPFSFGSHLFSPLMQVVQLSSKLLQSEYIIQLRNSDKKVNHLQP